MQDYFKKTHKRDAVSILNGVNRALGLEKDSYILPLGRLVLEKALQYLSLHFKRFPQTKNW